ncbi:MAG: CatA-like O-acetyltransferase, partial [Victivallaceae bacterium]
VNSWKRKELFDFYSRQLKCAMNVSKKIEVSQVVEFCTAGSLCYYPYMIGLISRVVNSIKEFRLGVDGAGKAGYWNALSPAYTIFHEDDETFSILTTEYAEEWQQMYKNVADNISRCGLQKGVMLQGAQSNIFYISNIPNLNFDAFSFDFGGENQFRIIVSLGELVEHDGVFNTAVALYLHHALGDTFHMGQFFERLQQECQSFR